MANQMAAEETAWDAQWDAVEAALTRRAELARTASELSRHSVHSPDEMRRVLEVICDKDAVATVSDIQVAVVLSLAASICNVDVFRLTCDVMRAMRRQGNDG